MRRALVMAAVSLCCVITFAQTAGALVVPASQAIWKVSVPLQDAKVDLAERRRSCAVKDDMHDALWAVAAIYRLLPSLPRKRQTRQLCPNFQLFLGEASLGSAMLHRVAARPALSQDSDFELETSPLERLLPYIGREAGVGIEAPKDTRKTYDELEERHIIAAEATQALDFGEPREFEDLMEQYRNTSARTGSGVSKLGTVYRHFMEHAYRILPNDAYQKSRMEKIESQISVLPEAVSLKLMRAIQLREYAYATRNDTSVADKRKNRALFKERMSPLVAYLDEIKGQVAHRDPYWYYLMIEARGNQQATREEIFTLVDEASKAYPNEIDIYLKAADSIVRISKQPFDDVEAIATLASVRNGSVGDASHYARVYWGAIQGLFGIQSVPALKVDWKRFAKGARDVITKYPVQWNIQHFAAFLCFAGEAEPVNELFKAIEGRPIRQAWGDIAVHDQCRQWAADPVNLFGKKRAPIAQ